MSNLIFTNRQDNWKLESQLKIRLVMIYLVNIEMSDKNDFPQHLKQLWKEVFVFTDVLCLKTLQAFIRNGVFNNFAA